MTGSPLPLSESFVEIPVAKKIAVIGGGVAGLSAAWHLQQCSSSNHGEAVGNNHSVQMFEATDRLGGHAWTVRADKIDVDIGFMVFNELNYPNLTNWFRALGVESEKSDMSLSVSVGDTVWSSDGLQGLLLANPSNLFNLEFYRFLRDLGRFHESALQVLNLDENDPRRNVTTAEYLSSHGYSSSFQTYYLYPMMAALWSASLGDVKEFPISQLIGFLANHQMLQIFHRPQWLTVQGRSQTYVEKVQEALGKQNIHYNARVHRVEKVNGKYRLFDEQGRQLGATTSEFDDLIFACHAPTAADILKRSENVATDIMDILGCLEQIQYADNIVYVHADPTLMPKSRKAWASWNCMGRSSELIARDNKAKGAMEGAESGFGNVLSDVNDDIEGENGRFKAVYVTYWLNRLQNLDTETNIFVSLNPHHPPAAELTYHRVTMAHPQFKIPTIQAREKLETLQGHNGLWFCGAWSGYGFHEDGCRAGFNVATALSGVPLPWASNDCPVLPPPDFTRPALKGPFKMLRKLYRTMTYDFPVALCQKWILYFLKQAVHCGTLRLRLNDGTIYSFGDGTPCGCDSSPVTLRIYDPWFFVKTALEYDLGLARSYMAGYFLVEPLDDPKEYHPIVRPTGSRDETTRAIGDPVGLTRLFLLLIGNRDRQLSVHVPRKSGYGHWYSGALTNASGLLIGKIGSLLNYMRYKLMMDNSERGGSLKNIHAHYNLSNDLFRTFLDRETLMYSSAIYDAVRAPSSQGGLLFRGTLEEAQWRKLDTLLARAQVQPGCTLLDIGFGWGGLSIHAAKKYGCKVVGITLSVEQKALAEQRVREQGVESLVSFEVVDYRTFARRRENRGRFDRVLSCEMIEAVGHEYLGSFFWAVEQVLAPHGILVMEAITTPEVRYENYIRSTDFINTIIFPGSCCPSLHALVDAAYRESSLTLEHIDNIGLHYAQTLAEWRRRFNASENTVRRLGFDEVFLRAWNYYLTYCEAGFFSQTENCLILVFARPGCSSLVPLCETRSVTQAPALTTAETNNWVTDGVV